MRRSSHGGRHDTTTRARQTPEVIFEEQARASEGKAFGREAKARGREAKAHSGEGKARGREAKACGREAKAHSGEGKVRGREAEGNTAGTEQPGRDPCDEQALGAPHDFAA